MTNRNQRLATRLRQKLSFESLEKRELLAADVVMFNDHVSGPATDPAVTTYAANAIAEGQLRDSATGAFTSISLQTQAIGASYENVTSSAAAGTDAHSIFSGWVDLDSAPGGSIALSGADTYTHLFSGLQSDKTYAFAGTAVRGRTDYTDRWTLVTLVGARSFTAAHSSGIGVVTAGLAGNQVAIWTGSNHLPGQGFVAQWTDIDAGADGSFEVQSQQYFGSTPGVGSGSSSSGGKGYGLNAIRLIESSSTFSVVSTTPTSAAVLTSAPTRYTVNFNREVDPTTVQSSDLTVDGNAATAFQIVDSNSVEFTLPPLTGLGFFEVEIAAGAITSAAEALPLEGFFDRFAIDGIGPGVVINEVHFDSGDDAKPHEFVELFDSGDSAVDVSGWSLDNAVTFTIPDGTTLGAGEYLVIARNSAEFFGFYGIPSIGSFEGRLSNRGETIELYDANGLLQDEVDYQLGFPWPTVGEVAGYSIQLINPALQNDLGGNWRSALATPAAANSVFDFNSPPQMRQVNHSPQSPMPGEDVTISMKVTDPEGVQLVTLDYQLVNPGDYIEINDPRYQTQWTTVVMNDDGTGGDAVAGDDIYSAVLPGELQTHRRLVRYRVSVADTLGASGTAPYADDDQPNFAYFVYGDTPDWTAADRPEVTPEITYDAETLNSVATYYLITTRQDHVDSQYLPGTTLSNGYGGSDYLWQGTLVYNGEVYDHIRYRARGGVWRYAMGKNMWKFDFNRGRDFAAEDDYGNDYERKWRKLNLSALIQQGDSGARGEQGLFEGVGFKLYNLAGMPAASKTQYVSFRIVENADENGTNQFNTDFQGLYMAVEQIDGRFLDARDLPDGNLYKMEGGTGVGGIGGELKNQGDYPQPSDSSDLIDLKTTYESGPQSAAWWSENLNLESYYSYHAVSHAVRHYDTHAGKNYYFYHNPETDLWEILPWDLDRTWWYPTTGVSDPFTEPILAIPEFARGFRNRMRELRDLLYNSDQTGAAIDEVASFVYQAEQPSLVDADRAMWDYNPILVSDNVRPSKAGVGRYYAGGGINITQATGSFAGMIDYVKQFVIDKGNWIDSTILTDESQIPLTPTISYSGAVGFAADALAFNTSAFSDPQGDGFEAMEWRIGEISNPNTPLHEQSQPWRYEITPVWESGELTTFDNSIDVGRAGIRPGYTYRARVRVQDAIGHWSHWSDPVEFVAGPETIPSLVITELHYHPNNSALADEDDQEFIEIFNTGSTTVDLQGIQIADFASNPYIISAGHSLAPGDYFVVPRNLGEFQAIYGSQMNLASEGYGGRSLSNGGETISLRTSSGEIIQSFLYDDKEPWSEAADGEGPSLEIIDPLGDPSDPANWQASAVGGGSPGASHILPGDFDRNSAVNDADLNIWQAQFGSTIGNPGGGADADTNGMITGSDFLVWQRNYGNTLSGSVTAPALTSTAVTGLVDQLLAEPPQSAESSIQKSQGISTSSPVQLTDAALTTLQDTRAPLTEEETYAIETPNVINPTSGHSSYRNRFRHDNHKLYETGSQMIERSARIDALWSDAVLVDSFFEQVSIDIKVRDA